MKTFKQSIIEEGKIFTHNFVTVITMLFGYHLLFNAPNLFGKGLGLIMMVYSSWLLYTAIKKSVDLLLDTYLPSIKKEMEELKKKEKSE